LIFCHIQQYSKLFLSIGSLGADALDAGNLSWGKFGGLRRGDGDTGYFVIVLVLLLVPKLAVLITAVADTNKFGVVVGLGYHQGVITVNDFFAVKALNAVVILLGLVVRVQIKVAALAEVFALIKPFRALVAISNFVAVHFSGWCQ
jgi:hypothetical protein